ncbi:MAG: response regulator [Thermoanaerobaculia bacterium]
MTKTILLADDSVTIQKVVELTFMDEDFRVSAVANGAEAIARLGESKPDIVIADIHMPGADGYEVSRRSKELYPSVPVLLLVGTFEAFDSEEAARSGADGHLKKPFDSQELMRRVRELSVASSLAVPSASFAPAPPPVQPAELSPVAEEIWEPVGDEMLPLADAQPLPKALPLTTFAPALEPVFDEIPQFEPSAPEPQAFSLSEPAPRAVAYEAPVAGLSDADIDRIARRMIELVGDKPVRDVAWEVVPDLAEVLLKSRIRELESSID